MRGERGRQVPVLMEKEVLIALQALIKQREIVGVNARNIYIFAAPTRG